MEVNSSFSPVAYAGQTSAVSFFLRNYGLLVYSYCIEGFACVFFCHFVISLEAGITFKAKYNLRVLYVNGKATYNYKILHPWVHNSLDNSYDSSSAEFISKHNFIFFLAFLVSPLADWCELLIIVGVSYLLVTS